MPGTGLNFWHAFIHSILPNTPGSKYCCYALFRKVKLTCSERSSSHVLKGQVHKVKKDEVRIWTWVWFQSPGSWYKAMDGPFAVGSQPVSRPALDQSSDRHSSPQADVYKCNRLKVEGAAPELCTVQSIPRSRGGLSLKRKGTLLYFLFLKNNEHGWAREVCEYRQNSYPSQKRINM